jgi:hypothetical protein
MSLGVKSSQKVGLRATGSFGTGLSIVPSPRSYNADSSALSAIGPKVGRSNPTNVRLLYEAIRLRYKLVIPKVQVSCLPDGACEYILENCG